MFLQAWAEPCQAQGNFRSDYHQVLEYTIAVWCKTFLLHFEVVFIYRLSSFWGCLHFLSLLHFKIVIIWRSSFWGLLNFEVIFFEVVFIVIASHFEVIIILKSSSSWRSLYFEVVFNLRLSSFWGYLHFEVVFLFKAVFKIIFILR